MPDQHRLKLFLSADLVGSTAFKQPFDVSGNLAGQIRRSINWQETIQQFYGAFETAISGKWASARGKLDAKAKYGLDVPFDVLGKQPRLWKTLGDELIYWKPIDHETQVWAAISVWVDALFDVRQELQKRGTGLDIKATCFCGEFPTRNRAVITVPISADQGKNSAAVEQPDADSFSAYRIAAVANTTDPVVQTRLRREALQRFYDDRIDQQPTRHDPIVDFIGPAIDVGFRIERFSTEKKMAVSLDVAYLLALAQQSIWPEVNKTARAKDFAVRHLARVWSEIFPLPRDSVAREEAESRQKLEELKNPKNLPNNGERLATPAFLLHYSGSDFLKGVLGGVKYPFFWINTSQKGSLVDKKDRLYVPEGLRDGLNWESLEEFCEEFYSQRSTFIRRPWINNPASKAHRHAQSGIARAELKRYLELTSGI